MKFALVSHALPPSGSGQAMIIYRLLRNFDPNAYCLISQQEPGANEAGIFNKLPGRYYHLPLDFPVNRQMPKWRRLFNIMRGLLRGPFLRGRRIAEIMRLEQCEAVVACTGGDLLNMPASYWASKLLGVPFFLYYMDDYATQVPKLRFFTRLVEPLLVKKAAAVITLNEFMSDSLKRHYGVSPIIIRCFCDFSDYQSLPVKEEPSREIKIVYAGAIYGAHFDAFRRLLAAINSLDRSDVKLHIYTSEPVEELQREGIDGPVVFHGARKAVEMPAIQSQADLLFLPLAFETAYPKLIKTTAPSKMGELLATGRPIIAHAPADSYLAWYFRQHECGLIVDESDPVKLAQAIDRILRDKNLQRELGARARERARLDFDVSIARRRFAELMKINTDSETICTRRDIPQSNSSSTINN